MGGGHWPKAGAVTRQALRMMLAQKSLILHPHVGTGAATSSTLTPTTDDGKDCESEQDDQTKTTYFQECIELGHICHAALPASARQSGPRSLLKLSSGSLT
jgi:hypothetical protein